jgi:hypothetical protein
MLKRKITLVACFLMLTSAFAQRNGLDSAIKERIRRNIDARIYGTTINDQTAAAHCRPALLYSFQHSMKVVFSYKRGISDTGRANATYWFSDTGSFIGYDINFPGNSRVNKSIYNYRDSSLIMLMSGPRGNMGFCQRSFMSNTSAMANGPDFAATGRSKTICGYLCKEMKRLHNGRQEMIWVTETRESMFEGIYRSQLALGMEGIRSISKKGVLEVEFKNNTTGESGYWKVVSIHENQPETISTEGFTFR